MDTRRELNFYSFYNVTGMRLHLERMAQRGWFLDRVTNFFWHYRRGEPRKLHYAVSYYARASMFEPEPSEDQQTFQDFCAHSGWTLAAGDAKLQIFCNEAADPVPIYTDPESEIEAIRQISRQQLVIYWLMLAVLAVQLVFYGSDLISQPIDALSNGLLLSNCCALLLIALYFLIDLLHYFRWRKKALAAAETGDFVPTAKNDRLYLPWVLLAAILVMGYGVISNGQPQIQRFFLIYTCGILALIFVVNAVRNLLRRKKVATDTNRAVTIVVDLVLAGLLTFGISFDAFHIMGSDSRPKDELLISADAIRGTVGENVKYNTAFQSSPFMSQYKGWQYPTDGDSLSYTVVDVQLPALIEPCLEQFLHSRDKYGDHQEDYDPDSPFYVYQPSSPTLWQADGAWQLYSYGTPDHIYLLRYGSRLVELDLRWEPSPEEISRAAAILTPGSN